MKINNLEIFLSTVKSGRVACGCCITSSDPMATEIACAAGYWIVLAAIVHILVGFTVGYWGARLVGTFLSVDERDARTISIEVGMQNGGMACALAIGILGSTLAAIPANAAAIVGSVLSPLLADYWSRRLAKP